MQVYILRAFAMNLRGLRAVLSYETMSARDPCSECQHIQTPAFLTNKRSSSLRSRIPVNDDRLHYLTQVCHNKYAFMRLKTPIDRH